MCIMMADVYMHGEGSVHQALAQETIMYLLACPFAISHCSMLDMLSAAISCYFTMRCIPDCHRHTVAVVC
jgi:hypothetical protein